MCLAPLRGDINPEGGRPKMHVDGSTFFGCGKCNECIKLKSADWALRAQHHISEFKENCFITLTYDEDNVPKPYEIKDGWKLFMKKLRPKFNGKLTYMVSHEYGKDNGRPHHHAILFNGSFTDLNKWKKTNKGSQLYTSDKLNSIWRNGFTSVGDANGATANYIASYALKGNSFCALDGEGNSVVYKDTATYSAGIGLTYLMKNFRQLVDSKKRLPRYYQKKMDFYKLKKEGKSLKFCDNYPDFKKNAQDYLQKYQDGLTFSQRSHYQIYASQLIKEANSKLSLAEFRSYDFESMLRQKHTLDYLKQAWLETRCA